MKNDLFIKENIIIPEQELEITTSRAGGPGGQHVNKSDTKIIIRWNVNQSNVLDENQKARLLQNLSSKLTSEGDLIVSNSETRSQVQNKKNALNQLATEIRKALYVPKIRKPTRVSPAAKETRLRSKLRRASLKKFRAKKIQED